MGGMETYTDEEAIQAARELLQDENFGNILQKLDEKFPGVAEEIRCALGSMQTKTDLYSTHEKLVDKIIESSTDGLTFSGIENVPTEPGQLFVSTHTNIILDSAFMNYVLLQSGRQVSLSALGDNLLAYDWVEKAFKLSGGFIVDRSSNSGAIALSRYINQQVDDGNSIWLAQGRGRSKDGNYVTCPSVLKMLAWRTLVNEYFRKRTIIPVAVSYEYDPCAEYKARELLGLGETSDFEEMKKDILGQKGRVKVSFGQRIEGEFDDVDDLAHAIDSSIYDIFEIWKTHKQAFELFSGGRNEFADYLKTKPAELRDTILRMYAMPAFNSPNSL